MSPTSIDAPTGVPGAGWATPLTVTLTARSMLPSARTTNSGAGPAPTTTSESQTTARRSSVMPSLTKPLLAWPSSARLLKPASALSGPAGTALLVALPGRGATVTTTPASPSIRLRSVPELSPGSDDPPNKPYQRPSGSRRTSTFTCRASMSMPWRPVIAVRPAAVPSSSTRVLLVRSLSAVAVAPPAKPPAVASERATGRMLRASALASTVRASTVAPLPKTALVRAVIWLSAVALDTEMKPPPLPEAVALLRMSVMAPSLKSPAASMVTPLAMICGAAPSSLRPRTTPGAAWPT